MAFLAGLSLSAAAQTITEFVVPTAGSAPEVITTGSDGALWFTEENGNKIGRITTNGVISEFAIPTPGSGPVGITYGPDGSLWFIERNASQIGQITVSGQIAEFKIPTANSLPLSITAGPDGGLWFTEPAGNKIGRITTDGVVTEFSTPSANSHPIGIRPGSDGNLWFTEEGTNAIGRITTSGVITEFPNPDSAGEAIFLAPGPDGNLYFTDGNTDKIEAVDVSGNFAGQAVPPTAAPGLDYIQLGPDGLIWVVEQQANKIGRLDFGSATPGIAEYPVPTAASDLGSLTAGPDGNLWFTEQAGNKIGRLVPPPSGSPLFAAVLPESRSMLTGNTATAFATIINAGAVALGSCRIVPITGIPADFGYQSTDAATNAPSGSPNTPVTVAGGGSQSFVVAFTANAPFVPTDVALSFYCNGADPAEPILGVGTLLLSGSSTPVPDVIALAATASNDGILDIPGSGGAGAFAIATTNVGAGGAITATADTGFTVLPLTLTLCQTNPMNGQCLAAPTAGVVTVIVANATPTFSVFATARSAVAFAPGTSRIFVRFLDATGAVRGATSVAVRTQ